jgi:hypothetical protein
MYPEGFTMPISIRGSYIFTSPGQKAFLASSNFVNYIELGKKGVTAYYLEAQIKNGEFVVSGTLYDSHGSFLCRLVNNNLEEMQRKCEMKLHEGRRGYKVVTENQEVVIELFIKDENICILKGTFYDERGELVAKGNETDFLIFKGPAVLGKSDGTLGIVLE